MPFRRRSRKPRSSRRKPRRRINHRRTKSSGKVLFNTRYSVRNRLPIAPSYYTSMEMEYNAIIPAGADIPYSFVVVPCGSSPFNNNSITTYFSPSNGDAGGSPALQCWTAWNYWANFYRKAQCLASSISIDFEPLFGENSSPDTYVVALVPRTFNGGFTGDFDYTYQIAKAPRGKVQSFGPSTTANTRKNALKSYVKTVDLYGISKMAMKIDNEGYDTLMNVVTSSTPNYPQNGIVFECRLGTGTGSSTTAGANCIVKMRVKSYWKLYDQVEFATEEVES